MPPPKQPTRPVARPAKPPPRDQASVSTLTDEDSPVAGADPNATVLDPGVPPPPRRAATAGARLSVTRGPKAGTEFSLGPGETSIGRQGDNTIVIPDISVSRKHVVVRKDGVAYILVDQGSGNGTALNGARVMEETERQDGDVIVMGDTEMTFLAARGAPALRQSARVPAAGLPRRGPSQARPNAIQKRQPVAMDPEVENATGEVALAAPHEEGKKRRKKLLIIAGSVVGFIIVLGIFNMKVNNMRKAKAEAVEAAAIEARINEGNEHKEEGKKATNANNFKKAVEEFKAAKAIFDEVGQEDGDLARRLEFAQGQVGAQDVVQVARELGERGELAAAKTKLDAIPEDSPLKDKVPELLEELKKRIPKRVDDAKAALESKSYDAARQAVTDITAIDPNNADAAQLIKDIEKAGQPPPKIFKPAPKAEDPTAKPMESFASGHLDEAIGQASACDHAACKALKEKLTAFRDAYANLEGSGNLEKAMNIIKTIPGGGSSPYMQRISAMGSGTFVKEGLAAMSGNNYPKAFSAFSKAQGVDSGNEVVKRNLGIIHQKAQELSEQAYIDMQQDPDKARRELEQIMQMTADGDTLHDKAKKRLKKISGGSGD